MCCRVYPRGAFVQPKFSCRGVQCSREISRGKRDETVKRNNLKLQLIVVAEAKLC